MRTRVRIDGVEYDTLELGCQAKNLYTPGVRMYRWRRDNPMSMEYQGVKIEWLDPMQPRKSRIDDAPLDDVIEETP